MLKLEVKGGRAVLVQVNGRGAVRLASFSADGVKWWRELFGDVYALSDEWRNLPQVGKAYLFARLYPHVEDKRRLVEVLKMVDDYEAVYWKLMIRQRGMRAVAAFKKLYDL
jgi:hypothetical protein